MLLQIFMFCQYRTTGNEMIDNFRLRLANSAPYHLDGLFSHNYRSLMPRLVHLLQTLPFKPLIFHALISCTCFSCYCLKYLFFSDTVRVTFSVSVCPLLSSGIEFCCRQLQAFREFVFSFLALLTFSSTCTT